MSCHKFSNFREKLNIDLNAKVIAEVKDVSENGLWTVCVKTVQERKTVTAPTEAQL